MENGDLLEQNLLKVKVCEADAIAVIKVSEIGSESEAFPFYWSNTDRNCIMRI